jgi:23S rRNA (pseudouridine1915-N3)-methyltransferase
LIKLVIVAIGKDKDAWISEGVNHYLKLLSKYASVSLKTLPDVKASSSLSPTQLKKKQAVALQKEIKDGYVVALANSGRKYDSIQFSRLLEKLQTVSGGRIVFLIGGAYGLDETLLNRADLVLSLSPLTFSHQLVRLVLLEQLYRGFNLLSGGSYHK